MTETTYKVTAIETVRTDRDASPRCYARLEKVDYISSRDDFAERLEIAPGSLDVGDIVTVALKSQQDAVQLKDQLPDAARSLIFLHHHDRKNQGDILSGPYNYFEFGNYERLSWDADILKKGEASLDRKCDLVMGGGIYFTRDKPRLQRLLKNTDKFIGWGIGLDARISGDGFTDNYTLLGTRERKLDIIDDKRVFYVPCSSCMNSVFEVSSPVKDGKIALHINGGFNSKELYESFPDIKTTTTIDTFDVILDNLIDCEYVITNSYHGAYWGSLLQKKVICIKTDVPKWSGLHENIRFATSDEALRVMRDTDKVPYSYYSECTEINKEFYQKVQQHLAS